MVRGGGDVCIAYLSPLFLIERFCECVLYGSTMFNIDVQNMFTV